MAKALNPQMEEEARWDNEVDFLQSEVLYMSASIDSWYNDLKYYLTHGSNPNHLDAQNK